MPQYSGRSSEEAPRDSPPTWYEDDFLGFTPSAQAFMDRYTEELINMSDEKYEQHKQTMQKLADQAGLTIEELEGIIFERYRPEDN